MTEVTKDTGDERLVLAVDEAAFSRDAVYAAAFSFLDRCFVRLDREAPGTLSVVLRPKRAGSLDRAAAERELREELARQVFRLRAEGEGRAFLDSVYTRAFGAPQGEAEGEAFEDPLGIALSWEEKQAQKEQST